MKTDSQQTNQDFLSLVLSMTLHIFDKYHLPQHRLTCKPGVAGSIHGVTSLSDETLSRGPVSI